MNVTKRELAKIISDKTGLGYMEICSVFSTPQHSSGARDEIAVKAMQGLLSNSGAAIQANPMSGWGFCNVTAEEFADFCYSIADEMLKASVKNS